MAVTIHVNGSSNSLSHKGCGGFAKSTLPDVCKTPSPGGPVPIPYPVIVSMSSSLSKGSKTVKVDGGNSASIKGSEFSRCTGDEPGTAGGVKSSTNMKEAKWLLYSFDVKIEGKNACRLSDKMMMNHGNTACLSGFITAPVFRDDAERDLWIRCRQLHDQYKDTQAEQGDMNDERYADLHQRVHNNSATPQERLDFRNLVDERIKVVKRLRRERMKYISMGCDQFDWFGNGSTRAEREARHRREVVNVNNQLNGLLNASRRA